jgi:hypothetical protein
MIQLGADMTVGTLLAWMKKPGNEVKRGEIIAEVDTEKARSRSVVVWSTSDQGSGTGAARGSGTQLRLER